MLKFIKMMILHGLYFMLINISNVVNIYCNRLYVKNIINVFCVK